MWEEETQERVNQNYKQMEITSMKDTDKLLHLKILRLQNTTAPRSDLSVHSIQN